MISFKGFPAKDLCDSHLSQSFAAYVPPRVGGSGNAGNVIAFVADILQAAQSASEGEPVRSPSGLGPSEEQ